MTARTDINSVFFLPPAHALAYWRCCSWQTPSTSCVVQSLSMIHGADGFFADKAIGGAGNFAAAASGDGDDADGKRGGKKSKRGRRESLRAEQLQRGGTDSDPLAARAAAAAAAAAGGDGESSTTGRRRSTMQEHPGRQKKQKDGGGDDDDGEGGGGGRKGRRRSSTYGEKPSPRAGRGAARKQSKTNIVVDTSKPLLPGTDSVDGVGSPLAPVSVWKNKKG